MKLIHHWAITAVLCIVTGCSTPPKTVDGQPVSLAESQAVEGRGKTPETLLLGALVGGALFANPLATLIGNRTHKPEDAVRKVRQTKQEGDSLTAQVNEAREHNQKLAAHCTELLGEVNALSGKPHATLDQRKDVLDQIKQQMSRMDFAGKQTDQAIRKNKEILATVKSSGGGHDEEMTELQAQIETLTAEKSKIADTNAKVARMHKEISSQ